MTVTTTSARHLLLRLSENARLPDALHAALRDEVVLCGWMRASGVLESAVIAVGRSAPRKLSGPLHLVSLEGSIGLAGGDISCGLRAVLARETDTGLETFAGEIMQAQVTALEVLVMAFDEIAATRKQDAHGTWLLDPEASAPRVAASPPAAPAAVAPAGPPAAALAPAPPPAPPQPPAPSPASSPTADTARAPVTKPTPFGGPIPPRPMRPALSLDEDSPSPEPGDVVEHFAFGRCEVVKSDGDRLHVRVGRDGRVKEIALEMLRVTSLDPEPGQSSKHYRLDRKL